MKQFDKLDLLICDEWGYVPIDNDGSKLLFQVISECYERKSVIITTNLEFAHWNDIFADAKITENKLTSPLLLTLLRLLPEIRFRTISHVSESISGS